MLDGLSHSVSDTFHELDESPDTPQRLEPTRQMTGAAASTWQWSPQVLLVTLTAIGKLGKQSGHLLLLACLCSGGANLMHTAQAPCSFAA